ncbi:MAG: type IV toxin-antitoxin system AbiEi family antitoxin [Chlamydiae bacterium]|nr:type IV toxin-antitoxin system AbiEi family antitoxin [Chlamydiota bacterium]
MKGRFLVSSNEDPAEGNIYADKSALILYWLLREGVKRQGFSLREVAKEIEVSVGLVQRVFSILVLKGLLQTEGIRTAKKFFFRKPKILLASWLEHYSLPKKCKMRTYRSAFSGKVELLDALEKSPLSQKVSLAMHSAAEAHGCKNTNLNSLELYMLDPAIRSELEDILQLEPQERGYEVLLIEPYYESLLNLGVDSDRGIKICPALLTYLDLYHFPLRGQEQAEFMAQRIQELKRMYKNG